MKYETKGTFLKKGANGKFTKTVEAQNEKLAKEKLYAEMGSKQGIRRNNIKIEEIKVAK